MIQCTNCSLPYPEQGMPYRCPRCGGLFDFASPWEFDPARVDSSQPGIWRYRHTFGLPDEAPAVSLEEGNTPLVWGQAFGRQVAFKCEYQNPTGSFKDRGSAPIVSFARWRGVDSAVEDSSGNAGASFAAYAARAGLKARVYVPDSASGPKRAQIEAYGAEVVSIIGPRSKTAEAVRRAAEDGATYASHAYLPFNLPGYATTAYEIAEQVGGTPGAVIAPAGQGGLLLGIARGLDSLRRAGVIESMPVIIGVQARACAPLWALLNYGRAGLAWVAEAETMADGIRVTFPLRGDTLLQTLSQHQGTILAVDEGDILDGRNALAAMGFYVEPTSAVVWGALAQVVDQVAEPVVLVLTGSGLKWLG